MVSSAEDATHASADRVRRSTPVHVNQKIDRRIDANVQHYASGSYAALAKHIEELDREWDVERVLEVNASTLAWSGLVLGATVNRKWLILPGIVLPFLLQHGVQGWCPPLSLLRRLGLRTRGEIDREKYALLRYLPRAEQMRH